MRDRRRVWAVVWLVISSPLAAQSPTIDRYEIRYYYAGAAQPVQVQPVPAGSYVCNLPPSLNTVVSNPQFAEWDDPAAQGRACRYVEAPGGPLVSFPIGNYEATLTAFNGTGGSPESNRAPFAVGAVPGAPTKFKVVR